MTLNHFNTEGHTHMINIGDKNETQRQAVVEGFIDILPQTQRLIAEKGHKKGDVLAVARLAAIMAAKKTADIIPLCHPIPITHIDVVLQLVNNTNSHPSAIRCEVTCKTIGKTGIEMEALVACNTALMTIYDMCKGVDRGMTITGVRLLQKSGGQSGDYIASPQRYSQKNIK